MAAIGDFDDDADFPPWDHLPDQSRPSPFYHAQGQTDGSGTGHRFVPGRHWCNLSQIVQCDGFGRYRCIVKDDFNMESFVAFYPDDYDGFDFNTLKPGHTLAIMYAHQHFFMDGTFGVRVENMDYVKVFPLSLQKFEWLGSAYHQYGKTVNGQRKCNGCDRTAPVEQLNRCAKCQQFCYCNRECQAKAWNKKNLSHKECCKVLRDPAFQALVKLDFANYEAPFSFKAAAEAAAAAVRQAASAASSSSRPAAAAPSSATQLPQRAVPPSDSTSVLNIALNKVPWFDDMYGSLMQSISSRARVETATTPETVLQQLATRPSAVFITDEALTVDKFSTVWDAVIEYIREGGTAVIGGSFTGFVLPLDMGPFFAKAGLPWENASYTRNTGVLNTNAVPEDLVKRLPSDFYQKAVSIKNVDGHAAWYAVCDEVVPPKKFDKVKEAPVAFAKVGEGNLGYVGDVNNEEEACTIIRAMLGVLG